MHYLFETEHFLFRKKFPGETCFSPERLSENNAVYFTFKKGPFLKSCTCDTLIMEFRSTGALAGIVTAAGPVAGLFKSQALCCLYEGFHKKQYKAELINALSPRAAITIPESPCFATIQTVISNLKTTAAQ